MTQSPTLSDIDDQPELPSADSSTSICHFTYGSVLPLRPRVDVGCVITLDNELVVTEIGKKGERRVVYQGQNAQEAADAMRDLREGYESDGLQYSHGLGEWTTAAIIEQAGQIIQNRQIALSNGITH